MTHLPPRHRGPNSSILTITIGLFVVAIVAVAIWGFTNTGEIDPTPMATSGPPGPGSIEQPDAGETGSVGTTAKPE
jgi:hypothetical protein